MLTQALKHRAPASGTALGATTPLPARTAPRCRAVGQILRPPGIQTQLTVGRSDDERLAVRYEPSPIEDDEPVFCVDLP